MSRIRTIKPELPHDEKLGACTRSARLMFVYLITQSDCFGNQKASLPLLRGLLFPFDDDITVRDIAGWLGELELAGVVRLYEVNGNSYLHLCGWSAHQKITKPSKRVIPEPPTESEAPELPVNAQNPPESHRLHTVDHEP